MWIGILIIKNPDAWGGYLQPWASDLLPVPIAQALLATAILDIVVGGLLLIDFLPWLAGLMGSIHLILVLTVSGITDITVRDIGLLVGTLAIVIDTLPTSVSSRLTFINHE